MARQYFIPGWGQVDETTQSQYFITGQGYLNATQASSAVASAAGTSTGAATSFNLASGVFTSTGNSSVSGISAATSRALANSINTSTALAFGSAAIRSVGLSRGSSEAYAISTSNYYARVFYTNMDNLFDYIDTSSSVAPAGVGVAIGTSSVLATGTAVLPSPGSSPSTSMVLGAAKALFNGSGVATGSSTAAAIGDYALDGLVIPSGASLVVSLQRTIGWLGDCCQVKRSSDGALREVGFKTDSYADFDSAFTWAAGSNLSITKWYDQSGNGHDPDGVSNLMIVRSPNSMNGIQGISSVASNGNSASVFLTIPNTHVVSRQSFSAYMCFAPCAGLFNSFGFWGLGTSATATNNMSLIYSSSSGAIYYLGSTFSFGSADHKNDPTMGSASTAVLKSDATTETLRYNGYQRTQSAGANQTLTGGYIGKSSWSGAIFSNAEFFAYIVYPTTRSGADDLAIEAAFNASFNVPVLPSRQVVNDGDSITCATSQALYLLGFIRQAYPYFSYPTLLTNMGLSGQTMATIYSNRANAIARITGKLSTVTTINNHIFAGTNDLDFRASGTIVGFGTTIWTSYLLPYILAMQAAGYNRVIVGTTLPRLWSGSSTDKAQKETERLAYNALIIANATTYGYTVADYASLYPPGFESVYTVGGGSVDGVHPTVATSTNMKTIYVGAVNPFL